MPKIILRFTRNHPDRSARWRISVPEQVGISSGELPAFRGNAGYCALALDFPDATDLAVWLRGDGRHARANDEVVIGGGRSSRDQAAIVNKAAATVRAFVPDTTVEWRAS